MDEKSSEASMQIIFGRKRVKSIDLQDFRIDALCIDRKEIDSIIEMIRQNLIRGYEVYVDRINNRLSLIWSPAF